MKKLLKKIFKITLLVALPLLLAVIGIILFPQRLFANKISYKEFSVYSNCKIDESIKPILDNASILVQRSELYDPNYKYNIIFCHNTFYNKIDDIVLGYGPAARSRLNNVIVKIRIDAKNNLAFPIFPKACEINLTELIAHEMTHCLQGNKYGIRKFNPFQHPEFWKLEGYPEYIARQKEFTSQHYDLKDEIDKYIDLESKAKDIWILTENGCLTPNYYYKGRLMIEYLINIKLLTYDQILKDTNSENTICQEMIRWRKESKD